MPNIQVKLRRGTAAEHDTTNGGFTGAEGEVTVDTTNDTLRVHDGSTAGGERLAKYSELASAGSGTVTSVDSGTGLTGGPITTSGTLSIANDGVGTDQIADNAVTSDKISDTDTQFLVDDTSAQKKVVVNESGDDVDFRVEGDTDTNLISTNASGNNIGMGKNPSNVFKLDVWGGSIHPNILNCGADNPNGGVATFIRNSSATGINAILQLLANSSTTNLTGAINLDLQSGVNEFFQLSFNNLDKCAVRLQNSNTGSTATGSGAFFPATNGNQDLGLTGARWDDVWSNGTFNGSDRNLKQDIEDLDEAEKRVAVKAKGLIKKFRWKDAVEKKGDDARIHVGVIAQELVEAFESEGLDPFRYSMLGKDTWWEGTDHNGQRSVQNKPTEGYTEVTQLSVRYNELLAFIVSAM